MEHEYQEEQCTQTFQILAASVKSYTPKQVKCVLLNMGRNLANQVPELRLKHPFAGIRTVETIF